MNQGTAVAKRPAGKAKAPAIVAAIERPNLALFEHHRGALDVGFEYDDFNDKGKLWTRCWPPGNVDKYTTLVPEGDCRALITELDAALVPAPYEHAKALTRIIMGRYAKRDLYDPEVFLFEITRVFGEAPADLGREATDRLRTNVFLPNVAEVKIMVDRLVQGRVSARRQAERHLAEHERRRAEAAAPPPDRIPPEQVEAVLKTSGVRKMIDDAEAERERPRPRAAIHDRAHEAGMATLRRERGEADSAPEEPGAEAIG